ncbi:hypothetical protein CVM73_35165 [Bradyrhizobium forestalis]|uniref:Uncharacterized protein n=1 Tax=Bradyrhizobium forestalis TaxID=1419263 RepID=A0A2M8QYI7_9BRAD|nr:hypothetical protein CVM73_35165 [Bradyrhizobium forestalis]
MAASTAHDERARLGHGRGDLGASSEKSKSPKGRSLPIATTGRARLVCNEGDPEQVKAPTPTTARAMAQRQHAILRMSNAANSWRA